jgi:hypothetical protein
MDYTSNIRIDSRGPLYLVLAGFVVVGRYLTLSQAEYAANSYGLLSQDEIDRNA